jgi:hypothetical protein
LEERPHNERAGKKSGGSQQLSDTTQQTWALLNNYGRVCVRSMPRKKRHIACDGWTTKNSWPCQTNYLSIQFIFHLFPSEWAEGHLARVILL